MPSPSKSQASPRRSTRGIPLIVSSSPSKPLHDDTHTRYVWQGGLIGSASTAGSGTVGGKEGNSNDQNNNHEANAGKEKKSYGAFLRIIEDPRFPTASISPIPQSDDTLISNPAADQSNLDLNLPGPSTPRKPKKTKSAKQTPSQASQLRFSLGDGVLVGCAGNSIGIGILVGLWEEWVGEDKDEDSDDADDEEEEMNGDEDEEKGNWEKFCEVRWCYRRQDLPNTMGQMKLVEHELLYSHSTNPRRQLSSTLPLSSLLHTCSIIASERFNELYPYWHGNWEKGWAYVSKDEGESEDGDDDQEEQDDEEEQDAEKSSVEKTKTKLTNTSNSTKGKGKSKTKDTTESDSLAKMSTASPPTISLSLSFSSFNPHRRPIPIVYYVTRAFDKFGKGGEGSSWWWVDWEETGRRGVERGEWGLVVDKKRGKVEAERKGKEMEAKREKEKEKKEKVVGSLGMGREKRKVKESKGKGKEGDQDMDAAEEETDSDDGSEVGYKSGSGEEQSNSSGDEDQSAEEEQDETFEKKTTPRKRKSKDTATVNPKSNKRSRHNKSDGTATTKHIRALPRKKHPQSKSSGLISSEIAPHLLPKDPYERALHLLHVGATPDSLPCREEEFVDVLEKVEEGVEGGGGGCLYIAGVPGTGKTATVHAVIKQLRQRASDQEIPPFTYVEINGLKVPTPQHAYNVLWEAISGQKSGSAKTSLRELEGHFREAGRSGPRGHTFVVLMDELDQLLTAKQDVVYNFFNWPTMRDSHLYVIAVANRMDLPQFLAAKVKSRLGLQSLLFQPYDKPSLVEIVQSRLIPLPEDAKLEQDGKGHQVLTKEAIELAAAKMAGTNGDARRVLDACRRAVETAIESSKSTGLPPKPVTIREMSGVLKAMTSSPVALFMKQCSLHQKMMMAAMLRCIRREGVPEITWRAMRSDHDNLLRAISDSNDILTNPELYLAFTSLLASHALTYDSHEKHKSMEDRKLALGMDANEVGRVLMAEGERWSQVLAGM